MNESVDHNNPGLNRGNTVCGYYIERVVELKEIGSFFYELEHIATRAKHIHISNNDKENAFSVAFKTVPIDSTGIAHILEHTVLCGSRKYPVRDPFFSMLKRSLSTYMNALTASDWTMYPFATQNKKDYYNLMDIYLDSAFFPNLEELSFKQEGHRLEISGNAENSDPLKLVYKGVVYNEMKGAMSSPDQVMVRALLQAIYPDTTYSNNSGGDPAVIPRLTHGQLKAFHRRHYHPSNAFFYTYGNLALSDHLSFIHDKVLNCFERIDPQTDVAPQPRWSQPQKATHPYPFGKNEDPSRKCQVCVAWLTADIKDSFEILILTLLAQVLIGNPASPLRKALIDSELGTALGDGTGFDSDNRDTMFAVGLKDVEKSSAAKIESIIFDVLKNLADQGVDKTLIESAIHQIEFHRKEVTNTPYPYGIKLLLAFAASWFHGGDPEKTLKFDADLERLRAELSQGPFFENRIKKYFLDNTHRVLFTLVPDQQLELKENERVAAELDRIRADMSRSTLEQIIEDAKTLKQLQESKEDTSCLPSLELAEIPPSVQSVKETDSYPQVPAICYKQPTAGIFYFAAVAAVGSLTKKLFPLVPFFCYALPRVGTSVRNYTEMAQLIDRYTGGIELSSQARTCFDKTGGCLPFISFGGKCLVRNQDKMFDIIEELLCKFNFSDLVRLKSLLLEFRAGLESMVVNNGHRLAISLAARSFSTASALGETWHGIHQLQTIKGITDDLADDKLESIAHDLSLIGNTIFTGNNLKIALIGEDQDIIGASLPIASLQKGLIQDANSGSDSIKTADGFSAPEIEHDHEIPREGWSTSSAVSFVASTFETVRMEHAEAPALAVISKLLRSMYLHREIREKGGAYGGFAIYNSEDGLFCFASYRDPHIVSTLKVYDGASNFIRSGNYTDEDIKEAILQVCAEIDKPDPPGPAAIKAFYRKIVSLSDEARIRFKKKLLTLTRSQVKKVAEKYFAQNRIKKGVAVISGEEKLKGANKKLADNPLKLYRI